MLKHELAQAMKAYLPEQVLNDTLNKAVDGANAEHGVVVEDSMQNRFGILAYGGFGQFRF